MAEIVLDGVTKVFADGYEAVKDIDLEIADGEFMILVGPSGCGKSTALRMIAGLEDITEGELKIGDDVVNDKAPKDRDIAMVFQNYALYPHMSVRDNMGFALKLAKVDKGEIAKRVEEAAKILDLTEHLERKPANLSGALAIAMFPPISIVGSLFDVWRKIGLFDTWLGLIIPYMTFTLPLAIYTLSAFYREIPWELEQAAQVDGATPFQAFTKVILPLAAPGTFTAAILVFIFAWNDFLFANTLTSTSNARTVPATLAFFTGASQFDQPIAAIAAAAVLVTIPIIIVVLIFQRRIVAGLTAGAVKG